MNETTTTPALSVQLCAWRRAGAAIEGGCTYEQADGFGVYIRNPLALHVYDFEEGRDGFTSKVGAYVGARRYADALAAHLGCCPVDVDVTPPQPRYCVDGHEFDDPDSAFAGDGAFPPFRVFDIPAQDYLPGSHPTRAAAQAVADRLNGKGLASAPRVQRIAPRGPAEEPLDFSPIIEGLRTMQGAVARMCATYYERDFWNDIQPPEMEKAIAMSLDDWDGFIEAAIEAWQERAALFDKLQALGFAPEMGGGGCVHLSAYIEAAGYVWITDGDGGGLPTPESWLVGVYGPNVDGGDLLWSIGTGDASGGGEGTPNAAGLLSTVEAALATAALSHAAPAAPGYLRSFDVTLTATGIDVTAANEAQALRYASGDLADAGLGPWNVMATLVAPAGDPQAVGLDTGWEVEVTRPGEPGGIWTCKGVRDVCVRAVDEAGAARVAADVIGATLVAYAVDGEG